VAAPANVSLDNLTTGRLYAASSSASSPLPPPPPSGRGDNQSTQHALRRTPSVQLQPRLPGDSAPPAPLHGELGGGLALPAALADHFGRAFGQTFTDVRIHPDAPAALRRNARALASGRDIAFAPGEYRPDTRSGLLLLGHELAHVVQQSTPSGVAEAADTADASNETAPQLSALASHADDSATDRYLEQEADRASEAALSGAAAPRLNTSAPGGVREAHARVQRSPSGGSGGSGASGGTAESPFAARIAQDRSSAVPASSATTIVMDIPGFGATARSRQTFVLDQPVTGATMVTVYAVPLSELYASPEDAAAARGKPEKDRHALSLAASPDAKLQAVKPVAASTGNTAAPVPAPASTQAAAPARTSTSTTTAPVAQSVAAASAEPTLGVVADAGPSPKADVLAAYDINGHRLGIIERSAQWGITSEYTKLSVGAAACGVVKTREGIKLIDAGVHHAGAEVDARMADLAMDRLAELIGSEPIRDIMITHAHLDHIALLERISKRFKIERITINAIQLLDPRFAKQAKNIAEGQREVIRKQLTESFEAKRDSWLAGKEGVDTASAYPQEAARDAAFTRWVGEQVALELAKAKPVEVHVALPQGSTLNVGDVAITGIDIRPQTVSPSAPNEGYLANDPLRSLLLDPAFKTQYDEFQRKLATDPNARFAAMDAMSSSYVLTLPNGNQLLVLSDIRTADIMRLGSTLVSELGKLDVKVDFRVWDAGHHAQSGWVSVGEKAGTAATGTATGTVHATGVLRASHLASMTEMLAQLTGSKPAAHGAASDVLIVSVDPAKVDPALMYILESSGLVPLLAHGEQDVQLTTAITAANRETSGISKGQEYGDLRVDPLLRRADIALQDTRRRLGEAKAGAALEKEEQKRDADTRSAELADRRNALRDEIRKLDGRRRTALKNVTEPGVKTAKTPIEERQARLAELQKQVDDKRAEAAALDQEVTDIRERVGPQATEVAQLEERIAKIEAAKTAFIHKVGTAPTKTVGTGADERQVLDIPADKPAPFANEQKALTDVVDPAYHEAIKAGVVPRLSETSLIVLGKNVAGTAETRQLVETWKQAEALRAGISKSELPLQAHAELIGKLVELKKLIAARKDIEGQHAVADELDFIDRQIAASDEVVHKLASQGEKSLARDPATGMRVETSVSVAATTEQAQAGEVAPETAAAPKPQEGQPADPAAAPQDIAPAKTGLVQKGAAVFGQAMGGVMVVQTISGTTTLLKRYGQDEANAAETAVGVSKSALGVSLGYRMLRGTHVGAGEFVVLSVLDVAQTALSNYRSTEEYNTEVAYAIVRNGVNLALSAVGMALIETANPVGIVAGLAVMLLGDSVLEWLGVHDWLAKKFAFMPDETIEVQTDLDKLIGQYNVIVGAIELAALKDESLKELGANDPAALRAATARAVASRRQEVTDAERGILGEFAQAYARAKQGYAGFRELDDLRFKFVSLYNRVHAGDTAVDQPAEYEFVPDYGDVGPMGAVKRSELGDTFRNVEASLLPDTIPADEVPKMEQWQRMDKEIASLVDELYHTDYEDIDWMKVSEYQHNLDLMVSNARYRLEPGQQGRNRLTAMFSPGTPARQAYETALAERENKLDTLRARQLDMAMHSYASTGVKTPARLRADEDGNLIVDPALYYEPQWSSASDVDTRLALAEKLVLYYWNEIFEMGELPEGLHVAEIYASEASLSTYDKAITNDGDYNARIFALRGSRLATVAGIDRTHRLLDAMTLTDVQRERLKKIDLDWKHAEEDRLVEYGYLLPDEVAPLKARIIGKKTIALAAALGETENATQLSDEARLALKSKELSEMRLSSLRDRVAELGLTLPESDDEPIERVYRLQAAPAVIVGVPPDDASSHEYDGEGEGAGSDHVDVIPLNAAAIAYYGDRRPHSEQEWGLLPVTLAELKKAKP
jgi:glyoxylase-like metal-dependent hydrolase (beta-lactamase superfamily II)